MLYWWQTCFAVAALKKKRLVFEPISCGKRKTKWKWQIVGHHKKMTQFLLIQLFVSN